MIDYSTLYDDAICMPKLISLLAEMKQTNPPNFEANEMRNIKSSLSIKDQEYESKCTECNGDISLISRKRNQMKYETQNQTSIERATVLEEGGVERRQEPIDIRGGGRTRIDQFYQLYRFKFVSRNTLTATRRTFHHCLNSMPVFLMFIHWTSRSHMARLLKMQSLCCLVCLYANMSERSCDLAKSLSIEGRKREYIARI